MRPAPASLRGVHAGAIGGGRPCPDGGCGHNLINSVIKQYNNDSEVDFQDLPPEVQTVIASVGYQYGTPHIKTPDFWGFVTSQDWDSAIAELWDFRDNHRLRREDEAKYLEAALSRS
jgi:hypothetical protein